MQRRIDPGKPVAWLGYVADMTARHGAPVELVVLTSSSKVARWAARLAALLAPRGDVDGRCSSASWRVDSVTFPRA